MRASRFPTTRDSGRFAVFIIKEHIGEPEAKITTGTAGKEASQVITGQAVLRDAVTGQRL